MKKFLGKLFTFALYAFVIGAIAKAGYDMFGDTDKLKREAELVDRFENFVPEEVSPYIGNPDDHVQYYYKSIGGDLYSGQSYDVEEAPSYATILKDNSVEEEITEYFSYDEKVHTFIIKEELLNTLESGFYYPIKVYYDDNTFEEFGFHVEDELVNNVPAFYAFRGDNLNSRIYNRLSDVEEISLYFSSIGDNKIVDVVKGSGGSAVGVIDPDNYVVSEAGNKVTFKKEYLQTLEPNTKIEYGVRLADGTILYEDWHYFWTIKDEWKGCLVDDVREYSLSEGGDYVINLIRNDTDKIFSFSFQSANGETYVEGTDLDFAGYDHYVIGGNTITVPEEMMKKLPADEELILSISYAFDYSRKIYSFENVRFRVVL